MIRLILSLVFVNVMVGIGAGSAAGQTPRPIHIWMDTTTMNVCQEGKEFQIPVYIDDIYYRDSVVGFSLSVWFDKGNIELDPIIVASQGTIAYQAKERTVTKDPVQGSMYVQAGNSNLQLIAGSKIPLFYLAGRVTAPDTLAKLSGWIQVVDPVFESVTPFEPITTDAGFIRVVRDTSAAYTGRIRVDSTSFDTLRVDTVSVSIENVAFRRVSEIAFTVKSPSDSVRFVDTVQSGTLAADTIWLSKTVTIANDSIRCVFVPKAPLTTNGTLIRLLLNRTTDSAFRAPIVVTEFTVNQATCLGKLERIDGESMALAIRKLDTSIGVVLDERELNNADVSISTSGNEIFVRSSALTMDDVAIYDGLGRMVPVASIMRQSQHDARITIDKQTATGVYAAVIRSKNRTVYKQFVLIK